MSAQTNWRWCQKCQSLWFAANASTGACPAGKGHDQSESGNYVIVVNDPTAPGQNNWQWCNKCQALTYVGNGVAGRCPSGGEHDHNGSGNYVLNSEGGQDNWRWCNKCQALTYAGNGVAGRCSAGGEHDHNGSGNYSLLEADGSKVRFQVVLTRLYCAGTTEQGHDEVYFLLGGVDGKGQEFHKRGPDPTQGADADNGTAWDMNDSGDNQKRDFNAILHEGVLESGESATMNFAFMESDKTNFGDTLQAAAKIAENIFQDPTAKAAVGAVEFIGSQWPTNQDDFLGSFYLQVRNANGNVYIANTSPGQHAEFAFPYTQGGNSFTYRVRHDDGDYNIHIQVTTIF